MAGLFLFVSLAALLAAIVFSVLWLVGKSKKMPNAHGKKAGIAVLVCVVSFIGFGLTSTPNEAAKDSKPAQQEVTQQEATQPPSAEQILAKASEKAISSYGGALVKYRDVTVTPHPDGTYFVVVNCNGIVTSDKAGTLKEYKIAAAHVMKEVFATDVNLNGCDFAVWMDVVRKDTGREENHNIYGLTVRKDAADKINWKNIDSIDITKSAEIEKILPPLR